MWGAHEGMGWWMVLGSVWFVLFWGAVIYFIVSAVGRTSGGGMPGSRETPLDILKRRYAAGEISEKDYERMREELG